MKYLISSKKGNRDVEIDWDKIASASSVTGCKADHCKSRYDHLKGNLAGKGPWSPNEDEKIVSMVAHYGMILRLIYNHNPWKTACTNLRFSASSCRTQEVEPDSSPAQWTNR